jgi:hypothetical protein
MATKYIILCNLKVMYIFGIKKNLYLSETLGWITIVLIFAKANLLSFFYWRILNALFAFFLKWAKGLMQPQKTYSSSGTSGKLNIFNKILRYVILHFEWCDL